MTTSKTFDCDICPNSDIEDGITLIFEPDMSGERDATIRVKEAIEGLKDLTNVPKLMHICKDCQNKISNPKAMEK